MGTTAMLLTAHCARDSSDGHFEPIEIACIGPTGKTFVRLQEQAAA